MVAVHPWPTTSKRIGTAAIMAARRKCSTVSSRPVTSTLKVLTYIGLAGPSGTCLRDEVRQHRLRDLLCDGRRVLIATTRLVSRILEPANHGQLGCTVLHAPCFSRHSYQLRAGHDDRVIASR